MKEDRPNPDQLLAQVQAESVTTFRGRLKIFFGYAAGVGKTFAMLETARRARAEGTDVVVGYVQAHGRPETEGLLAGLEALPSHRLEYRGVELSEFDVDAALKRHPQVLLVDELAHTNAAGSRHEKRWQDVEELLDAGISVWTTLNVQHIESLNDVIGQITGVAVRETVPDRIFDRADELELVDITPEELLVRLRAGKVYVSDQAQRAIQNFFQKSNLAALRELSLRQTAQRIHSDVESSRKAQAAQNPWATAERLLVCVGPSPTTSRVIRTAKRMATALDASWMAVSVDLTGKPLSHSAKHQIAQHFRLAERLGGETITLAGSSLIDTLIEYARSRNVTKILIGKTSRSAWHKRLFGTVVDELLEKSGEIDVYVIQGASESKPVEVGTKGNSARQVANYGLATLALLISVAFAYLFRSLHWADAEANTVMLFLAAVAWTAAQYGRGPAIYSSILAVLLFDFFCVPPYLTFAVADAEYVVTFTVMLAIGLLISTLASGLRAQVHAIRERERRTTALYQLGKTLSSLYGRMFLVSAAARSMSDLLQSEVSIFLRTAEGPAELVFGQGKSTGADPVNQTAANWAMDHEQISGTGTNTLPNATAVFFPLIGTQTSHGSIAIRHPHPQRLLDPDQRLLIESCASQLALALERDQLAIDAAEARLAADTEQVRSSMLSSISHDLKTPLAAIAGASSSLLQTPGLDPKTQRQLLETITDEAQRLNRLLDNILQMSKLDAGAAAPNKQWHVLEEIVGSALQRTAQVIRNYHVHVQLPGELPLIYVDGLLLEQVFVNLLENAAHYTPCGSNIWIEAELVNQAVQIRVGDNGPGLPPGKEARIFEKFFRASPLADGERGSGLGLAICRAIVVAHGGSITASNRKSGGAEFLIRLPLPKNQPQIKFE